MTATQSTANVPGTWRGSVHRSRITAVFVDPNGHALDLATYQILANGQVLPMVMCKACDFCEHVRLEGWMK